jgi:micrococcal nuclease
MINHIFMRFLGAIHNKKAIALGLALLLVGCGSLPLTGDEGAEPRPSYQITYPTMPGNLTEGTIIRIVDGDTAVIEINGRESRVRFIGMNTPESVAQNRPVECFGKEASKRAAEILAINQKVLLENDPSQDSQDRFGRLLRFVWLPDGRLFNLQMIAEGYAYEYTYDRANPYKYQQQFREAQRTAEDENRGLWAPDTCNGQR